MFELARGRADDDGGRRGFFDVILDIGEAIADGFDFVFGGAIDEIVDFLWGLGSLLCPSTTSCPCTRCRSGWTWLSNFLIFVFPGIEIRVPCSLDPSCICSRYYTILGYWVYWIKYKLATASYHPIWFMGYFFRGPFFSFINNFF